MHIVLSTKKYSLLVLFALVFLISASQQNTLLDSINNLREKANDKSLSLDTRISYLEIVEDLTKKNSLDSLRLRSNRILGSLYFDNDNDLAFKKINKTNLSLAVKLSDTLAMAIANFNLGSYFAYFNVKNDSAYYHYKESLGYYKFLNDIPNQINVLRNLADIQDTEKDYVGSQENSVRAIKLLESQPNTEENKERLWNLYNLLGITSQNLEDLKESIDYHSKAYEVADGMTEGDFNKTLTINNMAGVYRELKDYEKALEYYKSLLEMRDIYEPYDKTFYPLIIDNIAYTRVLSGDKNFEELDALFYEAYDLSNKLDDDITKLAVTIDLAKYYSTREIPDSTYKYAIKAYGLAKQISSNDILQESMIILSKLEEGDKGKKYLNEYIKLTDSLLQVERNVRNKFARIELSTDQLEAENQQISKENFYLILISIGLLLSAILVYVIISQRARNKELLLMQVQQNANEEIYNLMLNQQDKVEEARAQEKIRVSKELHDGVLGRLFGTRLSLDSLNFTEGKEAMLTRANYIGQLKSIEEDIRKISHEMNTDFIAGSGFMDILSELVETQTNAYGLTFHFNFTDDISWDTLPNKIKINVYRIIQESMQNIYKHAEATHIEISISYQKKSILLSISDNGKGFDTSKSKKGIGLKNMTSRVKEIKGEIDFLSNINSGTTVKVQIPYYL